MLFAELIPTQAIEKFMCDDKNCNFCSELKKPNDEFFPLIIGSRSEGVEVESIANFNFCSSATRKMLMHSKLPIIG
jgi:hypothetical protein